MGPSASKALLAVLIFGGLATPVSGQPSACRPPLKSAGGTCVAACPAGFQDRGRFCEQASFSPDSFCAAPLKFAAGACVAACPGGYEDRGRFCNLRSDN